MEEMTTENKFLVKLYVGLVVVFTAFVIFVICLFKHNQPAENELKAEHQVLENFVKESGVKVLSCHKSSEGEICEGVLGNNAVKFYCEVEINECKWAGIY